MADDRRVSEIAAWFRPEPNVVVDLGGRPGVIVLISSLSTVLIEDAETKERFNRSVHELVPWQGDRPEPTPVPPDLASLDPLRLAEGRRRLAVMVELDGLKHRTRPVVAEFAESLGISTGHLYELYSKWRKGNGLVALIPHAGKRKKRAKRLDPAVSAVVEAQIDELYLSRGEPLKEVVRAVQVICRSQDLKPPSPTTVRARILERPPEALILAREGRAAARKTGRYVEGPGEEPVFPLQRVQIDHTVADLFVIDPEHHGSVARPILTLAVDEYSRCVLGFRLRLARPSTLSVALALHHAVFPKTMYCSRLGIESGWEMYGKPDWLFTDNAAEFDSEGLRLGCEQHTIHHIFRPLDAPHFGGRVERLIGTLMGRLRLMPGATMRNIEERGEDYDPEKHAAYTIEEAERRIAIMIADIYHRENHQSLKIAPRKLWEFGLFGSDEAPGRGRLPAFPTNPDRFLLDFLPAKRRTIQDYGITINGLFYNWPVLKGLRMRHAREQFIVRFNPDDVTRIWVWDPEQFEYYSIPLASGRSAPAPLWEVDRAIAALRAEGWDAENENYIFRKLEQLRQEDDQAASKVKKARLAIARRKEAKQTSIYLPAAKPVAALPPPDTVPGESAGVAPLTDDRTPPDGPRRTRPKPAVDGWS